MPDRLDSIVRNRGRKAAWILTAAAIVIGALRAIQLRWACDDAFITFRYVGNIARGLGPVYNAGEPVEGYTHFLWLILLSAARSLGIEPVLASTILGILFYTGTIALLGYLSARLFPGRAFIPMAAFAAALHYDLAIWATGGLETALFSLLTVAAVTVLALGDPRSLRAAAMAGLLLTLGMLTRPDGAIFLACGLVWVGVRSGGGRSAARALLAATLPAALILLPYLVWKLAYYGDLLPNPYYAKSGGGIYWAQGFRYIAIYLRGYLSTGALLVALAAIVVAVRRRSPAGDPRLALLTISVIFTVAYAFLFVARVGGDFMYARFLLPIVPLIYLAAEIGLRRLLGARRAILIAALAAVPLLSFIDRESRDGIFFDAQGSPRATYGPGGIADEHWYWTHRDTGRSLIESYESIGKGIASGFRDSGALVLLQGQASLGYYADFDYCLEGSGLTDRAIARSRIERRGRPGHEKSASREELISRRIHLLFMKRPLEPDPYRSVYFRVGGDQIRAEMIIYDRDVMNRLGERFGDSIRFIDFEAYLDDYLASIDGRPRDEVRRDFERFRDFYFRHNADPTREAAFAARLAGGAVP